MSDSTVPTSFAARRSRRSTAGNRLAAVLLQEKLQMQLDPNYGKEAEAQDEEYVDKPVKGRGDDDDDDLEYEMAEDEGWEQSDDDGDGDDDDDKDGADGTGDGDADADGAPKKPKITAEEREVLRLERSSGKRKKAKSMLELMEEKARKKRVRKDEGPGASSAGTGGRGLTDPDSVPTGPNWLEGTPETAGPSESTPIPETPRVDGQTPASSTPTSTTATATASTRRKRDSRVSWIPDATPLRVSTRAAAQQNRAQLMERLQQKEAQRQKTLSSMRAAADALKARPRSPSSRSRRGRDGAGSAPMTQDERLARAAEIERLNSASLQHWQEDELRKAEERRAKIRAMRSREVEGPKMRFWSGRAVWVEEVRYVRKSAEEIQQLERQRRREEEERLKREQERERERERALELEMEAQREKEKEETATPAVVVVEGTPEATGEGDVDTKMVDVEDGADDVPKTSASTTTGAPEAGLVEDTEMEERDRDVKAEETVEDGDEPLSTRLDEASATTDRPPDGPGDGADPVSAESRSPSPGPPTPHDIEYQSLLASCSLLYLDHPDLPIPPQAPDSAANSSATTITAAPSASSRPSARQAARERDREAASRKVLEHLLGYDPYVSEAGHTITNHSATAPTTRPYHRAGQANSATGSGPAAIGATGGGGGGGGSAAVAGTGSSAATTSATAAASGGRRGTKHQFVRPTFTPGHRVSACVAAGALTCPITNRPAQYRDPLTGIAYRDRLAYGCLRRLVGHGPRPEIEMVDEEGEDGEQDGDGGQACEPGLWSDRLEAYLPETCGGKAAKGVPDGFLEPAKSVVKGSEVV